MHEAIEAEKTTHLESKFNSELVQVNTRMLMSSALIPDNLAD